MKTINAKLLLTTVAFAVVSAVGAQTEIGATRVTPNLVSNIDRPLRYRPDRGDFLIVNGPECFNRALYGGNTGFRVDGGDKPEFVLYLPGRGGNLRLGIRGRGAAKWLFQASHVETRYRPGELLYEVRDPLLGDGGVLRIAAVAYAATEGLGLHVSGDRLAEGLELVWAFGGVNGERGRRDGDIGSETLPISQWFQLRPEFCRDNVVEATRGGFQVSARPATMVGVVPESAVVATADAAEWNDLGALLESAGTAPVAASLRVVVGRAPLHAGQELFLSLQRIAGAADGSAANQTGSPERPASREVPARTKPDGAAQHAAQPLLPTFSREELPARFAEAEEHFARLRNRVSVLTPDEFINAAVGALNVVGDAVWDEPQRAIMHGAIAWRTRLLGWRGPYLLDALGWHERFRENALYWMSRQNLEPVPDRIPPPDENANLARNEAGLHTNGDLSHSHYDMNLVFIDALFRHLQWTGDLPFARQAWPVIERHLAWERRLFRREFGPDRLPLYEAYAAIWASDDLQYSGGGAMHASAYIYYENRQAARLARLLGTDPTPYEREAEMLARGMRRLLWVQGAEVDAAALSPRAGGRDGASPSSLGSFGWFAEGKDWLGLQRVHPSAALWTFYHTVDSEVPTAREAWQMADYVLTELPCIPVRGPGVPPGFYTLGTSNWMPYDWSLNNVVMAEALHGALALWQAGRPDEAWAVAKGSLLAAMFMGISPGNVGAMSYLDAYRRESLRDFADGAGVLSRAVVEGLFGVRPDALAGEIALVPGWPADWKSARLHHPDFDLEFTSRGSADRYRFTQHRAGGAAPLALRLRVIARGDQIREVAVNGQPASWHIVAESIGAPRIEVSVPAAQRYEIAITWSGRPLRDTPAGMTGGTFERVEQGAMTWLRPAGGSVARVRQETPQDGMATIATERANFSSVDLGAVFNDRVTQIFENEYRAPRSPFVSLALPKQGIGAWAGGVNRRPVIDDAGLRAASAGGGGRIVLPNGVPLTTPAAAGVKNVAFASRWENYPHEIVVPLSGTATGVYLLMAGSTNPMQSRFENGVVTVAYTDGTSARLPLVNPTNWWPIEQDYFVDDYQFRRPEPLPVRVDLKTGAVRVLDAATFKGRGRPVEGGAATVLSLRLDPAKRLQSLTVRATANDVVIGLMAATLVRSQ